MAGGPGGLIGPEQMPMGLDYRGEVKILPHRMLVRNGRGL